MVHALEVLINKEILASHNCPEMLIEGLYQRLKRFTVGKGKLDSPIMVGWGEGGGTLQTCDSGSWSVVIPSVFKSNPYACLSQQF